MEGAARRVTQRDREKEKEREGEREVSERETGGGE